MTPDLDFSTELADRLTSKRLPRMASLLVVTAGLTTATLLILAAGNTRIGASTANLGQEAAPRNEAAHAESSQKSARGSTYGAAVSALRGTVDLAANRLGQDAQLN